LQGTVSAVDKRWSLATVSAGGHQLLLPAEALGPGDSVRLRIASRDVSLVLDAPRDSSILNVLPVTIRDLHSTGALVHVQLSLPDGSLMLSCITAKSANDLQLVPGKALHAQVKGVAVLP
jgi:molybdate transport system ATP-binding protein